MFVVENAAGVIIAKFRSMDQVNSWAARVGIIMDNVSVTFNAKRINEREWVRSDYQ